MNIVIAYSANFQFKDNNLYQNYFITLYEYIGDLNNDNEAHFYFLMLLNFKEMNVTFHFKKNFKCKKSHIRNQKNILELELVFRISLKNPFYFNFIDVSIAE